MNTITLGGKPVHDPPASCPPGVYNCFTMHTGGARYGTGRFLMLRSDYATLSTTAMVSLVMTADLVVGGEPKASQYNGITMNVVVAGAAPVLVATSDGGVGSDDLVEVYVFDARCRLQEPLEVADNVQVQGFTGDASDPDMYPSTLVGGTVENTWDDVVGSDLALAALPGEGDDTNTALPSTWNPRNLIFDNTPYCRAVDIVASQLYYVVGWDWAQSDSTGYSLCTPGVYSAHNDDVYAEAGDYWIGGNEIDRNTYRRPSRYDVTFRAIDRDNPDDPYANRSYIKPIAPTGVGTDASNKQALHVGSHLAIYEGGVYANSAGLDIIAADIAARAMVAAKVGCAEAVYAGLWQFKPDGAIRGIQWISDAKGARTIVRLNNDRDFSAAEETRRNMEQLANVSIVGLGSAGVTMGAGGVKSVYAAGGGTETTFMVDLVCTNTGVTDGAGKKNAAPLWVYDIYAIGTSGDGVTLTDKNGDPCDDIAPAWMRVYGKFHYATQGLLGWNDDGTPRLWAWEAPYRSNC